jgi:ElaB/YqjD/DUF883 family membrane-anchored ribosome-binding protein
MKKSKSIFIATLLISSSIFISCNQKTTKEDVKESYEESVEKTGKFFNEKKDILKSNLNDTKYEINEYLDKATDQNKARLKNIQERLNTTYKKAEEATEENYEELIKEAKELKEEAKEEIEKIKEKI